MTASTSSLHEALDLLQATSQAERLINTTHPDLDACGPAVGRLLSRLSETCLRCTTTSTAPPSHDHVKDSAAAAAAAAYLSETLRQLADDKLNSFPYHAVPTCWRRLYMDAVLYGAIAQLAHVANSNEEGPQHLLLLQSIGRLDSAIVISGSPGPMRLELAQSLISLAQERLAAAPSRPVEATTSPADGDVEGEEERERERPAKRPRTTTRRSPSPPRTTTTTTTAAPATTEKRTHPLPYIHVPLRELASLPTFLDPAHNPVHRAPFIVRRGAVHFPAFDPEPDPRVRESPRDHDDDDDDDENGDEGNRKAEDHHGGGEKRSRRSRWSDLTYLRRLAGPGRVVPVEVGGDYTQSGWGQKMMPFDEFLDSLELVELVELVETRTGGEEDGASSARRRRIETPSGGDDDEEETGGGGGPACNGATTPVSTRTADSNMHEGDTDGERQSSPSSRALTTTATAGAEHAPRRPIYYLAQHSLFRQFPALISDLLIPDLVYSPPEHHYPSPSLASNAGKETSSYEPPQSEEGYVLNAWLGPGGTKSAAHTDPWWNCYVQMAGSKWIWVAPPECGPYMAAFGRNAALGSESDDYTGDGDGSAKPDSSGGGAAEEYMTNTSSLDVTAPPPLLSLSDSGRLQPTSSSSPPYPPQFVRHVLPHARQAVLEEGDVLVMPPKWWHAMVGLETSFSVSMWF